MRILLPPSESKLDGTGMAPLDLHALVAPQLHDQRLRLLHTLASLCKRPGPKVRIAIGTTANQDAELLRNVNLLTAPTAPAHAIYSGVLYDAIGLQFTTAATQRRIFDTVLVQSALFGVVRFGDRIPAYRCSADSVLPRVGRVGTYWRKHLAAPMQDLLAQDLVIDMRSGGYASMWSGPGGDQLLTIKVMQMQGGRRLAVSHFNKATKGQLVRALCSTTKRHHHIDDAASTIANAGYDVELVSSARGNTLEVLMKTGAN